MIKIFFTTILCLMSTLLFADELIVKGEAYDKANKLVFVESLQSRRSPIGEWNEIQIKYARPDGKAIAELTADFSKDLYVPNSVLIDHRFNEKTELIYDTDKQLITVKMTNLKSGQIKVKTFKHETNMVSTLGLHNFIIKHYDVKEMDIKLLIPEKNECYSFNFEREKSETEGHRRFAFTVSNWVLRAILKEIVMDYRDSDRALLQFSGPTEIESDGHDSQHLTIKLSHHGATNDK